MFSNLQKRVTAVEASPLRLVSPLLEEVEGGGGEDKQRGLRMLLACTDYYIGRYMGALRPYTSTANPQHIHIHPIWIHPVLIYKYIISYPLSCAYKSYMWECVMC